MRPRAGDEVPVEQSLQNGTGDDEPGDCRDRGVVAASHRRDTPVDPDSHEPRDGDRRQVGYEDHEGEQDDGAAVRRGE